MDAGAVGPVGVCAVSAEAAAGWISRLGYQYTCPAHSKVSMAIRRRCAHGPARQWP